jgi:hypothetical protein
LTIITAKAMATAGWNILTDDEVAEQVRKDWEEDENIQIVRRGGGEK